MTTPMLSIKLNHTAFSNSYATGNNIGPYTADFMKKISVSMHFNDVEKNKVKIISRL